MTIVSESLLRKIDESKKKMDNSKVPFFIQGMFQNLTKRVIENASIQDADNKSRKNEVIDGFKSGWDYAQNEYAKNFDLTYLTEIAGRVEPPLKAPFSSYADYRNGMAQIKYISTPPADRDRIITHLNRTIDSLEKSNFHPLEEAVFLYFHLIRIQPFCNGNKRTANIVMNTKLNKEGFLPITVKPFENSIFLDYLSGAIEGFNEINSQSNNPLYPYLNPGKFQIQLYDFLAKKELNSLISAENVMSELNQYDVHISRGERRETLNLKKILDSYFRSRNQVGQIKVNGDRDLKITGDIPLQTLEKIVSNNTHRKKIKINT